MEKKYVKTPDKKTAVNPGQILGIDDQGTDLGHHADYLNKSVD